MRIGTIIKGVFFLLALGAALWFYQEWKHQRAMVLRGQEVSLLLDRDSGPTLESALRLNIGIKKGDRRPIQSFPPRLRFATYPTHTQSRKQMRWAD